MTSVTNNLCVLTWKCLVLRKKNWLLTIFEIVLPLLMVLDTYYFNKQEMESLSEQENYTYFNQHKVKINRYKIHPNLENFLGIYRNRETRNTSHNPQTILVDQIERQWNSSDNLSLWKDQERIVEVKQYEAELQATSRVHSSPSSYRQGQVLGDVLSVSPTTDTRLPYQFQYNTLDSAMYDSYNESSTASSVTIILTIQEHLDAKFPKFFGVNDNNSGVASGRFRKINSDRPTNKSNYLKERIEKKDFIVNYSLYITFTSIYLPMVVSVFRDTIQEKSSGIKEMMRIMGVPTWMIWVHWFIYSMIVEFPVSIVLTVLLCVPSPKILEVNEIIVWVLIILNTVVCILILFSCSCLFDHATKGTVLVVLAWIIINLGLLAIQEKNYSSSFIKVLISLAPMKNICSTFWTLVMFKEKKVSWSFFQKGYTGSLPVGVSIIIYLVEIILFILVLAYLDTVKPGRYGIAKPAAFIFSVCAKLCSKRKPDVEPFSFTTSFEPPPKETKVGIEIRGLRKEFGIFKKFVAVERVDLDIYEREVMVLLGHNGAGKTTTMSMITGMFSPTSGTVSVDGENIFDNMAKFRQSLGLCTQHNLFFPKLTVIEHLLFFGMLKGKSYRNAKNEGISLLGTLNILDKANFRGSKLSGGMQRRLCLAVALIGNPKVLILDEPTSGLDPENRRNIWDIILSLRGERTILITTHYMEEADVLGDRIAIMDHGRVVCCGTAIFLKKLFGTGYCVHILKKPSYSVRDIRELVRMNVPNFKLELVSDGQVDFIIKDDFLDQFPNLFLSLEKSRDSLGITNISVSCSTMEDVFLKVAELSEEKNEKEPKINEIFKGGWEKEQGMRLYYNHFEALLSKRMYYFRRNIFSTVVKLSICCFLILYILGLGDTPKDGIKKYLAVLGWCFCFTCALSLFMTDFVPFLVEERVTGFKYQQLVAGVSPWCFWVSNFVVDFFIYLFVCVIWLILLLVPTKNDAISLESVNIQYMIMLLVLSGISSLIFVYVLTFFSRNSAIFSGVYLVTNIIFIIVTAILLELSQIIPIHIVSIITSIISLHPTLATIMAFYCIGKKVFEFTLNEEDILQFPTKLNREGILIFVLVLLLDILLYSVLLFILEWKVLERKPNITSDLLQSEGEDEDVRIENERVRTLKEYGVDTNPLRVETLVKKYRNFRAVNQVSFVVCQGECFGLLGLNGAGKTTTFKMLTGEIMPSSGDAFSFKFSVVRQRKKYFSYIGYCPQFDAVLDDLTGKETLSIIAKIRGVPRKEVSNLVDAWLIALGIKEYAKKCTKTYSGGTKRKLSSAMAFIGDPDVALLDEPTTGVDPVATRKVWGAVQSRQKAGYSAVLSSHSMEECEALCSRLTIMRSGKLCCIGSLQHLKTKFGHGYSVSLKISVSQDDSGKLGALHNEFTKTFPKSIIQDSNITMITYRVLDSKIPLSRLFSEVLRLKNDHEIVEDFIVSNATLEQLFLDIARN